MVLASDRTDHRMFVVYRLLPIEEEVIVETKAVTALSELRIPTMPEQPQSDGKRSCLLINAVRPAVETRRATAQALVPKTIPLIPEYPSYPAPSLLSGFKIQAVTAPRY